MPTCGNPIPEVPPLGTSDCPDVDYFNYVAGAINATAGAVTYDFDGASAFPECTPLWINSSGALQASSAGACLFVGSSMGNGKVLVSSPVSCLNVGGAATGACTWLMDGGNGTLVPTTDQTLAVAVAIGNTAADGTVCALMTAKPCDNSICGAIDFDCDSLDVECCCGQVLTWDCDSESFVMFSPHNTYVGTTGGSQLIPANTPTMVNMPTAYLDNHGGGATPFGTQITKAGYYDLYGFVEVAPISTQPIDPVVVTAWFNEGSDCEPFANCLNVDITGSDLTFTGGGTVTNPYTITYQPQGNAPINGYIEILGGTSVPFTSQFTWNMLTTGNLSNLGVTGFPLHADHPLAPLPAGYGLQLWAEFDQDVIVRTSALSHEWRFGKCDQIICP